MNPLRLQLLPTKCQDCQPALCCTYWGMNMLTPSCPEDYDDFLWYVLHQGVTLFKNGEDWYLKVDARCEQLGKDDLCQIYDRRPRICREYDPQECDKDAPAPADQEFSSFDQLEQWCLENVPGFPPNRED